MRKSGPSPFRVEYVARAERRSRSDGMTVAVGFSPRMVIVRRWRRGATQETPPRLSQRERRSATPVHACYHRGLKPTATLTASLRDVGSGISPTQSTVIRLETAENQ